mgnify:CR=1 FL=1
MPNDQAHRIYQHPAHALHQPPAGHAESPQRWHSIAQAISDLKQDHLSIHESPMAKDADIHSLHPQPYWQDLKQREPNPDTAPIQLDPDTWLSYGSIEASARAAGAVLAGLEHTWHSQGKVFCAARPPGHHAGLASPMGFCLINPIAIGAHHAIHQYGAQRVAIVDFDVHHGNGTQDIFVNNPQVLYASSHQSPLYPGTGHADETGVGNIINRPLEAGTGSAQFRAVWSEDILPRIAEFKPEILFISAGFDAHKDDPLAQLALETDDYRWIAQQLSQFANQHCQGRSLAMSEGGYDLTALTQSVIAFTQGYLS